MPFGADLRRATQQRDLGRALLRAQPFDDRVGVLHRDARMAFDELAHKHPAARQRVGARKIGVLEIVEREERQAGRHERIDDGREGGERSRRDAERPSNGRGVWTPAVVERRARLGRRHEQQRRSHAAPHDHDERGVRLVEVGQIVERRNLAERSEVGDRRPSAERDDNATVDPLRERVTPSRELPLRNLRRRRTCAAARARTANCLIIFIRKTATSNRQLATVAPHPPSPSLIPLTASSCHSPATERIARSC